MSQLGLDFGPTAPPPSSEAHLYWCFKPPLVIAKQAMSLGDELKAEGVFDTVRPSDKLHVSIVSAGPYQNLQQIVDRARKVGDQVRCNRFTFEFTELLPFGGPTAVLSPGDTPEEATRLQQELALGIQRPGFRPAVGLNAHMTISYTDKPIAARPLVRKIVWPVTEYFLVVSRRNIGLQTLGRWDLA